MIVHTTNMIKSIVEQRLIQFVTYTQWNLSNINTTGQLVDTRLTKG